ncbi:hypothetical protein [Pasteuria penetrans]|nr:hypothetical protein [Pasteuria penetrans]
MIYNGVCFWCAGSNAGHRATLDPLQLEDEEYGFPLFTEVL